jgi:hypothetical protein
VIPAHSTVPRWPTEPPSVDPSGRSYVVLAFGSEALQVASDWRGEIARRAMPFISLDGGSDLSEMMARLTGVLGAAVTGLRLMVAGPEQEVLAVQATARAAGMLDAELALHVTSSASRRVYCVHCKTTSSVKAQVNEVSACHGCGRELLVFAHFSRRSGSYLGFLADAEERG